MGKELQGLQGIYQGYIYIDLRKLYQIRQCIVQVQSPGNNTTHMT